MSLELYIAQQIINAVALGSLYALVAIGLSMIFGILRMTNFAHGDMMMVGAYATLVLQLLGIGFGWAVIAGIAVGALAGVIVERVAYRPVRGAPEVTLLVVDSVDEAIDLFNRYSPQFVATLLSPDAEAHLRFYQGVNAPFVGDGFTRWVDGQYALNRPELGLSNWEAGRTFARGGILSGDGVYTVRTRVSQTDPKVRR